MSYCRTLILLTLFIAVSGHELCAQDKPPKREFRAAWVATVKNIDYPSRQTADPALLKAEYLKLVDEFKKIGLNAVIFQVRPAGDALYASDLAPWSSFLTGKQGKAPDANFDPLPFFIEETHRRGMEFHAWLNPYRATMDLDTLSLSAGHMFNRHRDWMVQYGGKFYFNPGIPEVRTHLVEVVADLVERYDIDAVHFDDYFYPYKVPGEVFPDSLQFMRYGEGFPNIEDWRRNNTDQLISELSLRIRETKPFVRFGISPFGVWRNAEYDPQGSPTRAGATTYDDLYADVRKWLLQGWIDYVVPQLYWHIGFPVADHRALLDWWSKNSFGRQLYIGHAIYKVGNNQEKAWYNPGEIPHQLLLNRINEASTGSAFFRAANLFQNPLGVTDSLRSAYRYPALIPEAPGPRLSDLKAPELVRVRRKKTSVKLEWRPNPEDEGKQPLYYVIYRFEPREFKQYSNPRNIFAITPIGTNGDKFEIVDDTVKPNTLYTYAITAVNRYHRESESSNVEMVRVK